MPASDADLIECQRHLRQLGEGVAAYRQDHDGLFPPALGDLFGRYLTDPAVLKCPAAVKSGVGGPSNPNLLKLGESDRLVVGYNWELSWEDPPLWEGQGYNFRFHDFKQLHLRSLVGENVPIIRCTHHGDQDNKNALNLTASGRIYTSGEYWESEFVDILPGARLAPELAHTAYLPMSQLIRPRSERATDRMIDLRHHYNARFEDPWVNANLGQEWTAFAKNLDDGLLLSRGIVFDPAGIIQWNGKLVPKGHPGYSRLMYPTNVPPIMLKRAFQSIHVVGGVVFESVPGAVVARLEFFREDGSPLASWEWKYGIDVSQVMYPLNEGFDGTAKTQVAWTGDYALGRNSGRRARLFHLIFTNPEPAVVVSHLRLFPGDTPSCPLIAAISVEP